MGRPTRWETRQEYASALTEGDGHRILRVSGAVDLASSRKFRREVEGAIRGARSVSLHMGGVTWLDTSGIAVLVVGLREAKKADVAYRILEPSPAVARPLEMVMLDRILEIDPPLGGR